MIFSRDVYKVGVKTPQLFARKETGVRFQKDWGMYFTALYANTQDIGELPPVSPWHGIACQPFKGENVFNYVNEIPLGTREKIEISTKEEHNPLRQDIKKVKEAKQVPKNQGALIDLDNGGLGYLRKFTYGDIPFNYGCIPRTWENPDVVDTMMEKGSDLKGDGDPIDVVELSRSSLPIGSVSQVRVLGVLGLVDEGEADWKILACDYDDPTIKKLSDVSPARVKEIVEWFRNYKTTDGKPKNDFAFGAGVQDEAFAMHVLENGSDHYKQLRAKKGVKSPYWMPTLESSTVPPSI
jgi:inorganic pyrophosphatase